MHRVIIPLVVVALILLLINSPCQSTEKFVAIPVPVREVLDDDDVDVVLIEDIPYYDYYDGFGYPFYGVQPQSGIGFGGRGRGHNHVHPGHPSRHSHQSHTPHGGHSGAHVGSHSVHGGVHH